MKELLNIFRAYNHVKMRKILIWNQLICHDSMVFKFMLNIYDRSITTEHTESFNKFIPNDYACQ